MAVKPLIACPGTRVGTIILTVFSVLLLVNELFIGIGIYAKASKTLSICHYCP